MVDMNLLNSTVSVIDSAVDRVAHWHAVLRPGASAATGSTRYYIISQTGLVRGHLELLCSARPLPKPRLPLEP